MGRHFRHTVRAAAFCAVLLACGFVLLFHTWAAKSDPIAGLLKLPAPPPPNPLVHNPAWARGENFYDRAKPPADDAQIDELLDYWAQQSVAWQKLRYNAEASERTRDRILKEIQQDPKLLPNYLNLFNDDAKASDAIYEIYNREGSIGTFDRDTRKTIRDWLMYHSPYLSQDLERVATQAGDTGEYVSNQDELLALTRVDFDRARPIIDRLYGDSGQKVGPVLAKWALYRHALDKGDSSDIDRYRRELQDVVEDKAALPGARDLAFDALVSERDWSGRDEWYYSLLGDETLSDLKINGSSYTGLTTIILYFPPDKYASKMIDLLKSNDPVVRGNAVRNLISRVEDGGPDVVRALLPWLEDEKWAKDTGDTRGILVRKLSEVEMPEAVPGLIKVLEEHRAVMVPQGSTVNGNVAYNAAATAANAAANAMRPYPGNYASNAYGANAPPNVPMVPTEQYPYRSAAVYALTKQKDPRSVPALRRTLNSIEAWERSGVVKAIFASRGFTLSEQLDALETAARGVRNEMTAEAMYSNTNMVIGSGYANTAGDRPLSPVELRQMLADVISQTNEVSDELARAVVDRIEAYDKRDPEMAAAYRRIVLGWPNAAVNILFLRDTKRDAEDTDTLIRLLSQRKQLREKQPTDVFDLRTGSPRAIGVAACLLEDKNDYETILDTANAETKTALMACARLIRAPLNVQKVAANLTAKDPLLVVAAEKYLESEDSPAARTAVLSRHPGEALILGSQTSFAGDAEGIRGYESLAALFQSVGDESLYNGWGGTGNDPELEIVEKRLSDEVKRDTSLVGIYAYDKNYIRIYQDKVLYAYEEDDSRYRERPLTHEEFEDIKSFLAAHRADELPPFLFCGGAYCSSKELVMLGRNGGRRVYLAGDDVRRPPEFFAGLDKYFEQLRKEPGTLKYALSREIPGLAIVYASDAYKVATVWGDASGVSVGASETAVREKVEREIAAIDNDGEESQVGEPIYGEMSAKALAEWNRRLWEGYGWYQVGADQVFAASAAQPAGVYYLPQRDGLAVAPTEETWKARAGTVEIRASGDGLFKVQAGRVTKVLDGDYGRPVISSDGRWVLVNKASGEYGQLSLVRVDLVTRREYPVVFGEEYGDWVPKVYMPGLNAVLVQRRDYVDYVTSDEDDTPESVDQTAFRMVEPVSGRSIGLRGDMRPFGQTTFRPLQHAAKAGELWAAIPDSEKNETEVGTIDTRTFTFKPILRVPKIKFDSMRMWVDEPHSRVYFVYRGHLLSLPIKLEAPAAPPRPSGRRRST